MLGAEQTAETQPAAEEETRFSASGSPPHRRLAGASGLIAGRQPPPGNVQGPVEGLLWRESFRLGLAPCDVPLISHPLPALQKPRTPFSTRASWTAMRSPLCAQGEDMEQQGQTSFPHTGTVLLERRHLPGNALPTVTFSLLTSLNT